MSTIERMHDMLDKYPTKRLRVIFDPVNLLPYCGIKEKDGVTLKVPSEDAEHRFVSEALDVYGTRLAAIHCKDYVIDDNGFKHGDIPALTGIFRWKAFAEELRRRNIDVPWLLENHNPLTVKETADTIAAY